MPDLRLALAVLHVGEQALEFSADHLIALAGVVLQPGAVGHRDVAAAIADQAGALQGRQVRRDC